MQLNKIYCGDCYELIKQIPDKSIDLIVTDPPYFITGLHNSGILRKNNTCNYLEMKDKGLGNGVDSSIFDEWVRVMKHIYIYVWCNKEQIYDYMSYFVKQKKCNFEVFVWCKPNCPPFTNGHYLKDKEYCLLFWEKGKCKLKGKYENMHTYFVQNTNVKDRHKWKHPTIKPIDFIKNFILNSTEEGDVVLDTFAGSGTTCVAAKQLNRNYIGFEKDEEYWKIANERINEGK